MPSREDLSRAAVILGKIQNELQSKGDSTHDADLQAMLALMESPVFRQITQLQASIHKLKEEVKFLNLILVEKDCYYKQL